MSGAQPERLQTTEVAAREAIIGQAIQPPPSPIAPYRAGAGKRYEGSAPWRDMEISVILPILEFNKTLPLVLEAIRLQTLPCVIYIVDTGSILTTDQIDALRSPRTEVIQLRCQGWFHTSWPVAAALDAVWGIINTPFAFFTHDDCFLKKQTCFEELLRLCKVHHAVGHQITPRQYDEWALDFGHTCLMLDVAKMDTLPLQWNMRVYGRMTGVSIDPALCKPNVPDTESQMNWQLRRHGLVPSFDAEPGQPLFIGREENRQRNTDEWIDHCRSMTCGFLYAPDHAAKAGEWATAAMEAAELRHRDWREVVQQQYPTRHLDWLPYRDPRP